MTVGQLTLTFESVPIPGSDQPNLISGTLLVSGNGSTSGSSSVDGTTITYADTPGVQRVTIAPDASFDIVNNGSHVKLPGPHRLHHDSRDPHRSQGRVQ